MRVRIKTVACRCNLFNDRVTKPYNGSIIKLEDVCRHEHLMLNRQQHKSLITFTYTHMKNFDHIIRYTYHGKLWLEPISLISEVDVAAEREFHRSLMYPASQAMFRQSYRVRGVETLPAMRLHFIRRAESGTRNTHSRNTNNLVKGEGIWIAGQDVCSRPVFMSFSLLIMFIFS